MNLGHYLYPSGLHPAIPHPVSRLECQSVRDWSLTMVMKDPISWTLLRRS